MRLTLLTAAFAVSVATAAHAGTFEIKFSAADLTSNPSIHGDVFVTTTDTPVGGAFTATAISGSQGTDTVTSLSAYALSDQLIFPADPYFDLAGVSFSTALSGDFNLYTYNGGYYELSSQIDSVGYAWNGTPINITVDPVPEPASIALFGVGILGLVMMLRSRNLLGQTQA